MMRRPRAAVACVALIVVLAPLAPAHAAAVTAAAAPSAAGVRAGEWWLSKLGIERAWTASRRGAGVTVAVLDSGVQGSHPDLRGAVSGGTDVSGRGSADGQKPIDGGDGAPEHGTTMAGFIGGRGHGAGNRLGMLGVAPAAKLLTVSFGGDAKGDVEPAEYLRAVRWAVDHGADVINMSFGAGSEVTEAVHYAQSKDVVVVAGADNRGAEAPGLAPPAGTVGVVGVAGVDKDLRADPGSGYGGPGDPLAGKPVTASNILGGVAVTAPFSTTAGRNDMPSLTLTSKGTYTSTAGNSNATAIVSGVVALIRAAHPDLDAANVIQRLITTTTLTAGLKRGQYADRLGFGVVNAYAAVTGKVPSVCESTLGSLVTGKAGVWKAILENKPYTPECEGGPSGSGSAPSSSAPSSAPSSQSAPSVSSVSSQPQAGVSSSDDGGVPVWVWPVAAVVVLGVLGLVLVARRRRPAHGPPPGPFGPPPGPRGGFGPPGRGG